jgi:hypothetical protein
MGRWTTRSAIDRLLVLNIEYSICMKLKQPHACQWMGINNTFFTRVSPRPSLHCYHNDSRSLSSFTNNCRGTTHSEKFNSINAHITPYGYAHVRRRLDISGTGAVATLSTHPALTTMALRMDTSHSTPNVNGGTTTPEQKPDVIVV